MPQSLSSVYLHLVFSTKERRPFLRDESFRSEMHAYLVGVSRKLKCPTLLVGGVEDHVHVLAQHNRTISQSHWAKELKRASSTWANKQARTSSRFSWQAGYGVFSVSASKIPDVRNYIARQEEHHRRVSFKDEFRALLTKHNVDWDERYVWD